MDRGSDSRHVATVVLEHDARAAEQPATPRPEVDLEPEALPEGFQYLQPIGAGGMASVHSVRDLGLLRVMAMKVLSPALAERPAEVERFLREAQITAQLDHPNIVPVHELGTDRRGNRFFTMKQVEGRTLTQWIAEAERPTGAPAALDDLLLAFLKVCEAVAFAHSRGVLHCDLKPDNIMVGSFGQVYVMDWGLAIVKHERDASPSDPSHDRRVMAGTPCYMSPEQVDGDELSEQTDVFGLGAVLYSVLTGVPPYDAEDTLRAMEQARAAAVAFPPSPSGASLPLALCEIVKRATARAPADRYASVVDLKKDVEAALRALPFAAQVYAPGSRIVTEGEPGDCAFVIARGACVASRMAGGQKVVLRRLRAGDVFGETAVLTAGGVRTATVEAEDEVVVRVVSRQLLEENVGGGTPFGAVVVALAERFREADGGKG